MRGCRTEGTIEPVPLYALMLHIQDTGNLMCIYTTEAIRNGQVEGEHMRQPACLLQKRGVKHRLTVQAEGRALVFGEAR